MLSGEVRTTHSFGRTDNCTTSGLSAGNPATQSRSKERGQVIGNSETKAKNADGDPIEHAFLWENGKLRDLGTLGAAGSTAVALNERGQIIGTSEAVPKDPQGWHTFIWEDGRMSDIDVARSWELDINEQGQILGGRWTSTYGPQHAFVWNNGKMTDLGTLGGKISEAHAINRSGQVVGASTTRAGAMHAFVWEKGTMTDLGSLGKGPSRAVAVNNKGQVVGYSATGEPRGTTYDPPYHAVRWTLRP